MYYLRSADLSPHQAAIKSALLSSLDVRALPRADVAYSSPLRIPRPRKQVYTRAIFERINFRSPKRFAKARRMQHDGVLCAASRFIRVQATPDRAGQQPAFR